MNKTIIVTLTLTTIFCFVQFWKKRERAHEDRRRVLLDRWCRARGDRRDWEDENRFRPNFDDPEYQSLWNIEIGAEDLYLMHIKGRFPAVSWSDYCRLRDSTERAEM